MHQPRIAVVMFASIGPEEEKGALVIFHGYSSMDTTALGPTDTRQTLVVRSSKQDPKSIIVVQSETKYHGMIPMIISSYRVQYSRPWIPWLNNPCFAIFDRHVP